MAKRGRINVRREGNRVKGAVIRQYAASFEAFLASRTGQGDRTLSTRSVPSDYAESFERQESR